MREEDTAQLEEGSLDARRRIRHILRVLFFAGCVFVLVRAFTGNTFATEETRKKLQEAKDQKEQTESTLSGVQENITDLNEEKDTLQGELSRLNKELTEVSDNLAQIEFDIGTTQDSIEVTRQNLEEARNTEASQYAAMKKRVQFIYEEQEFLLMDMLFGADDFGDFLNHGSYIAQLSAYDRKKLTEYQNTRSDIEFQEQQLTAQMEALGNQERLASAEQAKVSGLVNATSGSIMQYADEIADAEAQADALQEQIKQEEQNIKELEAKLAEEIRLSSLARQSSWRDISEVTFADGDRYLLANLIYCEAGNQPYEGKLAVGAVVMNRVLSSVFPDTIVGVIYQRRQFSPVDDGHLPLALAQGKATDSCYQAADAAMSGETNVGNCVFFRTPIPGLTGIQIGGHIFY